MRKGYRIWITVEEYDADRPEDCLADTEDIVPDFGPSRVFVADRLDAVSVSRAKDRAIGFAEQLHEAAAALTP